MNFRIGSVLFLFAILPANILFAQNNLVANPNFNEIETQKASADYPRYWQKVSGDAKMIVPKVKNNGKWRLTFNKNGSAVVQALLCSTLEKGLKYKISCKIFYGETKSKHFFDQIGVYLSGKGIVTQCDRQWCVDKHPNELIDVKYSSLSSNMYSSLNNQNAWMEVSGIYTAQGGEQFISVGFFGKKEAQPILKVINDDEIVYQFNNLSVVEIPGQKRVDINYKSAIYFETGSAELSATADTSLSLMLDALKANPSLKIKVIGYTDNAGDDHLNYSLSIGRAIAVSDYLINNGIAKSRILYKGLGVSSDKVKDKQKRRVDVSFFTSKR